MKRSEFLKGIAGSLAMLPLAVFANKKESTSTYGYKLANPYADKVERKIAGYYALDTLRLFYTHPTHPGFRWISGIISKGDEIGNNLRFQHSGDKNERLFINCDQKLKIEKYHKIYKFYPVYEDEIKGYKIEFTELNSNKLIYRKTKVTDNNGNVKFDQPFFYVIAKEYNNIEEASCIFSLKEVKKCIVDCKVGNLKIVPVYI